MQEAKKADIIQQAETLGTQYQAVSYNGKYYIPEDFEYGFIPTTLPAPERTYWREYAPQDLVRFGNQHFDMTYLTNVQMDFMHACMQHARYVRDDVTQLLLKTDDGLQVLHHDGSLRPAVGDFIPNLLPVPLNNDPAAKDEVRAVILDWLGDNVEQYTSLMHHLATILAPGWSINRYVILLGAGRNGKSVLMHMLQTMLGLANYSSVTRQHMAGGQSEIMELNNKLLNCVMDGQAKFVTDSGNEKTLIAGEPLSTRKRYANHLDVVRTNALFVEGLNKEPRTSDTSAALQARLVRFEFPNTYAENRTFMEHMTSEPMVGALLSLLIDHFVEKADPDNALQKTATSFNLQVEQALSNDLAMQFLMHYESLNPGQSETMLQNLWLPDIASMFNSWAIKNNDITARTEEDIKQLLSSVLKFKRGSVRQGATVLHRPRVQSLTPAGMDLLYAYRLEDTNDVNTNPSTLVED